MRFVQAGVMLLGVVAYVVILAVQSNDELNYEDFRLGILLTIVGWNSLLLIVTVLVIVDSIRKIRASKTRELAVGVFVVKLAEIPFFLINFAVLALIFYLGFAIILFGGVALQALAAAGMGLAYLAMLSTSVYGWASIVQLRRERRIDTVLAVLYTILLFVPVADIVAAILLFVHSRPRPQTQAVASRLTDDPDGVRHPVLTSSVSGVVE